MTSMIMFDILVKAISRKAYLSSFVLYIFRSWQYLQSKLLAIYRKLSPADVSNMVNS